MRKIIAGICLLAGSALVGLFGLYLVLVAVNSLLVPNKLPAAQVHYQKSMQRYAIPDVTLVKQDGVRVPFRQLINTDHPVVVNFLYTRCTTMSCVLATDFTNLQRQLGSQSGHVQMISISIDPENDTPGDARTYLERFQAKPGWDFLTGGRGDIDKVLDAFAANMPSKSAHYPLTLLRSPRDGRWLRITGLMSPSEFLEECHQAGAL